MNTATEYLRVTRGAEILRDEVTAAELAEHLTATGWTLSLSSWEGIYVFRKAGKELSFGDGRWNDSRETIATALDRLARIAKKERER